jgi:hypothetical protein
VELQKYHESAVDSEDNVPCTRNTVAQETKVYGMPNKTSTIHNRILLLGNTVSAVESEEAGRGFRALSGDFEQVTRPQNKSHDVIDMDWSPPVELQKYHESAVDSEDNVPCTRNTLAQETKVYDARRDHMKQGKSASLDPTSLHLA